MSAMTALAPSRRALVTAVFGDDVDPEALWAEVAKLDDPSDFHAPGLLRAVKVKRKVAKKEGVGERVANGIGLGATAIGTGYGVRELAEKLPDALPATKPAVDAITAGTKKIVPKIIRTTLGKPKVAAGLAAGLLAGDATATAVLHRNSQKLDVDKNFGELVNTFVGRARALRDVHAPVLAQGKHAGEQSLTGTISRGKHEAEPNMNLPKASSIARVKSIRGGAEQQMSTTSGKVLAGTTVATGLYANKKRKQVNYAYGKADTGEVTFAGTFSKFDDDKQRAYGWASVVELDGQPVIDRQGDYISLDDIEEAAYVYVRKSRVTGDMHRRAVGPGGEDIPHKVGELIESVVFTPDKCEAMGVSKSLAGRWWMGVQVEDEQAWAEVKKKARTGFSIHGKGIRKATTEDEIRGYG